MKKNCYITTPIYYASGNVHIGNAYTTIAGDALARFKRLQGIDTFYLTGMDEHGLKIQQAAEKEGITPQALVDRIALNTSKLWSDLGITNDYFIRTTDQYHMDIVSSLFEKFLANDDIYLSEYTGDYCVSCEAFFTKTQLGPDNTCPDCGKPTTKVSEQSYFFRLKKYEKQLLDFIKTHPDFIQPETRRNEVISFVESGLEDLCISRTTFSWGIPVKSNPKHVIYVWLDALFNYLTALKYPTTDNPMYQKYWENAEIYQLIGKDILRFHAVYWPIFLMAAGVPINNKLYVHGWVNMKDGKMSKSKGNTVYPHDIINFYSLDALRYYLCKELPIGNDGIFTYERFFERFNTELANDFGNLVSRTIAMINKYFDGEIAKPNKVSASDTEFEVLIEETIKEASAEYNAFHLQNALSKVWKIIDRANKYIDETAPWVLAKDEAKQDELRSVMYHLAEAIRIATILLSPVLIESTPKVLEALGGIQLPLLDDLHFGYVYQNKVAPKMEPLFKRIDANVELERIERAKAPKEVFKPEISFDEFSKIDLRIGEIIDCQKCENSDKLLLLKVKIGTTIRDIVSGIATKYQPKELIGKKVIVVCNLAPAKIRGHQSNGMLLCATSEDDLLVLESPNSPSGAVVK